MPIAGLPMTPFAHHTARWGRGCGSEQCQKGSVCLFRGVTPCNILLVGEAPAESENTLGAPFVGPAGHLLDRIITFSIESENLYRISTSRSQLTWGLTNIVGCLPREEEGGKASEPDDEQIECCQERLIDIVRVCDPRLLVAVGKLADIWTDSSRKGGPKFHSPFSRLKIMHPAAILRMPIAGQGLAVQRCVVQLRNAAEKL